MTLVDKHMMHKEKTCLPHRQDGVGMIEVLVAVFVLSVGILGLAGVQGFSMQSNYSAYLETRASQIAYGVLDDMRARRMSFLPTSNYAGLAQWQALAAAQLPNGNIAVDLSNLTTSETVVISVAWLDDRSQASGGAGDLCAAVGAVGNQCRQIQISTRI